jgi:CelD/BcsL family acetyltransferase involved in cellulose biosynthesis
VSSLRTEIRRDLAVFDDLAPWWDACPGPRSIPFLRSEWFRLWSQAFLPHDAELEVVLWRRGGNVIAALPLSRSGMRRSSLANAHSEVFDLIAEPDASLAPAVGQWFARRPVVRLFRLEGGSVIRPAPSEPHWRVDRVSESPYIDLSSGLDVVEQGLGRKLRKNLERGERGLAGTGEVVYLDNADDAFPDAVHRCLKLEAAGWKGETGSAVLSRRDTTRFYGELVELARDRGWLRLCVLLVAERLAAFELDLDVGGRRFCLKTSFDESLGRFSPGKVLQLRALRAAHARGLTSYEIGGEAEAWKMDWTSTTRTRVNALSFASVGVAGLMGRSMEAYTRGRSPLSSRAQE